MEYVSETILEDPYDEDTREFVREILMEALSLQFDVDGAVMCGSLFALLDNIDQQLQGGTTTATLPIASPPMNTKIRPTPNWNINASIKIPRTVSLVSSSKGILR